MVLSYNRLVELVEQNIIEGADPANINGSSIDITLGSDLLIESFPEFKCPSCGDDKSKSSHLSRDKLWEMYVTGAYVHCDNCIRSTNAKLWIRPVDFSKKESISFREVKASQDIGYVLMPGECCLAHTVEKFNLPMHITAEYRLKSSMARVFLEHLHAAWCDPGWNNSVLTLEFKNESKYHPLLLKPGMKCGQVMFYEHEPVPKDRSYTVRGQYNNQNTATPTKGMK